MALYTGKGDAGTTKLFDSGKGQRVSKSSEIFEALGTLDELNAILGWAKVSCAGEFSVAGHPVALLLHEVQDHIFTIQAEVAGAGKTIPPENVTHIENLIAEVEGVLPEITTFFVPGGTERATRLEVARTVSRRAERRLVALHESGDRELAEATRAYANRLSSLLYALARFANHQANITELPPAYKT